LNYPSPATSRADATEERATPGKAGLGRHPATLTLAAFVLFLLGAGLQYALGLWLGSATTLSRDAQTSISFGAEAVWFLLAGFALSFVGRGYRPVEHLVASLFFGVATFFVLRGLKPPSFSYDRFFASPGELLVWALCAAVASWLLAMWGASFGMLIGANGRVDPRLGYEWGIARTHLRLNRRTARVLLVASVLPPLALWWAGELAWSWDQMRRATTSDAPPALRVAPRQLLFLAAAVLIVLALVLRFIKARAELARLHPGQRRKRPATVVMTGISIAGVAVGVWALTVVLSVMSGFESDLKRKILGTNSHALLLKYSTDFSEWRTVMPKVAAVPGVAGVSPFILNEVILSHGQTVTGAELKGIDPATVGSVSELPHQVIAGDLNWIARPQEIPGTDRVVEPKGEASRQLGGPDYEQYLQDTLKRRQQHPEETPKLDPEALRSLGGICIGKEMSHQLRAWVGDVVNVLTPLGEMTPTGPVPRSRPFRVACILYSGMYEYDSKFVYIGIPEAQKFFRMGDNVVGLELKFVDVDAARALGRRVVATLGGFPYRTKDWAELNRNLFSALKLEKLAMAIILTFIVLVACFNILSTLIMLVLEKTKEISILKSMGARDASVMKIFVVEGLTIGAVGTAMGLLLGLASCSFIEKFGLQLDPDVYYISNLPVNVDGAQFVMVAAISLALSYLATLYPATKASRLSPVDGLREE
jgi:lipoprotein-releasing system permease protein